MDELDEVLREQAAYYRAFAGGYDQEYHDSDELSSLESLTEGLPITGDVLELACGTGQWTRLMAERGLRVTAVDGSPEMIARASERVGDLPVEFLEADLFDWRAPRRFDTVFFGFWLSHVPPERFAAFWRMVGEALRPGGQACFIDSGPGDVVNEEVLTPSTVRRELEDGTPHRVVKLFHDPPGLTAALAEIGWSARVWPLRRTLIAGTAAPLGG